MKRILWLFFLFKTVFSDFSNSMISDEFSVIATDSISIEQNFITSFTTKSKFLCLKDSEKEGYLSGIYIEGEKKCYLYFGAFDISSKTKSPMGECVYFNQSTFYF